MKINLEFSGGAELLFDNTKKLSPELPDEVKTMKDLLPWIRDNLLKQRPQLWMQGETIRPGILILINEADWELENSLDYVLQPNDTIVFISTLHGG